MGSGSKSRHGLRWGGESLDLFDPVGEVGDIGEDVGVDGVSAVKTPAAAPSEPRAAHRRGGPLKSP